MALPKLDLELPETRGRVGKYKVLWDLGAGEFGKVRACIRDTPAGEDPPAESEYALKSINKSDVSARTTPWLSGEPMPVLRVNWCYE